MQRLLLMMALAPLCGGLGLTVLPVAAAAGDPTTDDLNKLRAEIQKEIAALKKQEIKLHQQFLDLDRKSQLLDRKNALLDEQLRAMRATGTVTPCRSARGWSAGFHGNDIQFAGAELADTVFRHRGSASARRRTLRPRNRRPSRPARARGESAPIAGPSAAQQQARQVVETAPSLSSAGGVLTPKGQFVIDPSIEFDYWSQNQFGVNGFQIIPGITFGNIFANHVEQNILTTCCDGSLWGHRSAGTERSNSLRLQFRQYQQPYPGRYGCRATSVSATGASIGDLQFGASYQINSGDNGWPIFVANGLFKTATG